MAQSFADKAYLPQPSGRIIMENKVASPAQSGANRIPSGVFAGAKLVRGSMISKLGDNNGRFYRLWFLWNPNTITLGYGFNDAILPQQQNPGSSGGLDGFVQGQQITFSLLFNRMFEVGSDPNSLGVLEDVAVFDHIVGSTSDDDGSIANQYTYLNNAENTNYAGMLTQRPITVSFGGTIGGLVPALGLPPTSPRTFSFDGYITGAQWTFDMFTARMVPITAQLDITMTRMFFADDPSGTNPDTTPRAADGTVIPGVRGAGGSIVTQ